MVQPDGVLPSLAASYARALVPWKRAATATTRVPVLQASVRRWRPDPLELAQYRAIVGSRADLPIVFPQVPLMALTVDLLTRRSFPVRALGLIHRASVVEVLAAVDPDQPWDLAARTSGGRHVRSGLEFEVTATASAGGTTCWTSRAVYLSRSTPASGAEPGRTPQAPVEGEWADEAVMPADVAIARAFARICGDVNPIHTSALAARALGFPRPIAHGWWLAGRVCSLLGDDEARPGRSMQIEFRRPVLLPSVAVVRSRDMPGGERDFVVVAGGGSAAAGRVLAAGRVGG